MPSTKNKTHGDQAITQRRAGRVASSSAIHAAADVGASKPRAVRSADRRRRVRGASAQTELPFRTHGGARRGAGRKPGPGRPRQRHAPRPRLGREHPVHITTRLAGKMPSLRSQIVFATFKRALLRASKDGLRIVHFSLQRDHIHLIVEATDHHRLGKGIGGFKSAFARKLNALLGRHGRVFDGRYHRRDLTSPREVRNALVYVLQNGKKHGVTTGLDTFSSAPFFDGWAEAAAGALQALRASFAPDTPPTVAPATWLLRIAWRRHGLIGAHEKPSCRGLRSTRCPGRAPSMR